MSKIDYFAGKLERGEISRREFMARAVASGFTVAVASTLATKAVHAAAPRRGGNFRIGIADFATTDSLDPALSETRMMLNLNWQLRNSLVEVGPGGSIVPELAESWEGSADAATWVFKLRKGVEFHNGKSLTTDDVIYSIDIHRKEDTTSSAKPFATQIAETKATGPLELTFKLNGGNRDFPATLGLYNFCIVPEGTTDFSDGNGTGGYILERFEPGVSSSVKRNPNNWKQDSAHFETIEILGMKDVSARSTALITDQIDAYNFVELRTAKWLRNEKNVRLLQTRGKAHYGFAARTDLSPFDNNDARLALKYGIDREDILQKILKGYGSLGNDQPISPSYRFFRADLEQRVYDPDKARFHAKKAGIDGVELPLHVAETPFAGATDTAVLYAEHMKKADLNLKIVREPDDGFWSDVWAKKPFFATRWSGRITEDVMLSTAYSAAALKTGWNETHYDNPQLDKLIDDARVESDEGKRAHLYGEIQEIIRDDGGIVVPVFADFVDAVSDKIGHTELSSDWDLDGGRCGERWWFV